MSSTVKKPSVPERSSNNSNSMKQQSQSQGSHGSSSSNNNNNSSSSSGKPNAWSKPLQGAAAKKGGGGGGAPSSSATTTAADATTTAAPATTKGSNSSNNNNTSITNTNSKAPPGLPNKHHHHPHHHNQHHQQQHSEPKASSANLTALRERYLHLMLALTGQKVTVTVKSGDEYTGILHTATPFSHLPESQRHKYVLKAVTTTTTTTAAASRDDQLVEHKSDDDAAAVTVIPGQTVLLDMDSVVQLHVKSCRLDSLMVTNKNTADANAFTDTEISGGARATTGSQQQRGKDLVQADATWTSAGDAMATPTAGGGGAMNINSRAAKLAGSGGAAAATGGGVPSSGATTGGALKGSIAGWDQFKANEELFNVVGSYDETVYTTVLDHRQISAAARQRAEQLAREIESTATTNLHVAEERGHALNQDYDEEDRYSGVLKPTASTASAATTKPKLNYAQAVAAAAAAAAASNNKSAAAAVDPAPPGFGGESKVVVASVASTTSPVVTAATELGTTVSDAPKETETTMEETKPTVEEAATKEEEEKTVEESAVEEKEEEPAQPERQETEEKQATAESKSKLSASAKSFSFNINAKTFMPTPPPPPPPPPQYAIDPTTGIPMMMTMGGPMMPGGIMLPMMNPGQYPGMPYAGHYPIMEHVQQMPIVHPMQQPPPPGATSVSSDASSPANVSDEGSVTPQQVQPREGDGFPSESTSQAPQQQPPPPPPPPHPQQQQQQHHMPMQPHMYYPGGYYNPALGMHPQHHPQHFMHPQMAAHMQRQMYPMQAGMPPNMMRGPPYYPGPNGPMPYPQYGGGGGYGEEDGMNYGGRGGRGGRSVGRGRSARGQGRGGPGGRIGGGRVRYNHQYSGGSSSQGGDSGRETPQDQPHTGELAAPPPPGEEAVAAPKSEAPAPCEVTAPPVTQAAPTASEEAGGN